MKFYSMVHDACIVVLYLHLLGKRWHVKIYPFTIYYYIIIACSEYNLPKTYPLPKQIMC